MIRFPHCFPMPQLLRKAGIPDSSAAMSPREMGYEAMNAMHSIRR